MLKDEDKWYIKGYKIYRSNAQEHRKGVAILCSTELICQTYITYKDNLGRFIKIKIKIMRKNIQLPVLISNQQWNNIQK